jgi:hypothetical protein
MKLDRRSLLGAAALTALAPTLSSCLMARESSTQNAESKAKQALGSVKFAFAPEAIWDYMKREGVIARFEAEQGLKIQAISTWDEFTFFAGGHGELVSTATYELPVLEKQTKVKTVTFGKYNLLRITPVVRTDSPYQTLADIPKGSKIAVPSTVASTLLWGMFARELHDLDFRVGGGDFQLVVEDHFVMPEHLDRGDVEAALVIPDAAIGLLRQKRLRVLYDNKLPYEIYGGLCGCQHRGVMGNLEKDEDIKAMQDYLAEHDWFVESVYLDQAWIDQELRLYDLMKSTGFMDKDAPTPRFEVVKPGG